MAEYKVTGGMKLKEIEGKYGKLAIYALQLEGEADTVELSQKIETPAPKVGDKLNGTIDSTQYGKRFKKEQQAGGGGRGMSPEQIDQIIRQNALQAAATVVAGHSNGQPVVEQADLALATAKKFEQYIRGAGQVTAQQAAQVTGGTVVNDDQPPAELYDNEPVNLDEIPF